MQTKNKEWVTASRLKPLYFEHHKNLHPLAVQLLYNRLGKNIPAGEQFLPEGMIINFFQAGLDHLADPFLMSGMRVAVQRIRTALETGERLCIYGDFDADGVTGCALLVQALRALGADVFPYIPRRLEEGYGLNNEALNVIASSGTRVVITCDCGISNVAESAYAKGIGLDLIITDHHRPPDPLPVALALLNPRLPGDHYPDKGLAGVGVAYTLVRALAAAGCDFGALDLRDLLDLVAIGTVADLAPLTGENRILVREGLLTLARTRRPGVLALLEATGAPDEAIDSERIAFRIGPRINAAGRLDDAILSYELLLTDDLTVARNNVVSLNEKNKERQRLTARIVAEARALVVSGAEERNLILVANPGWAAGVVGLVASRLVEEFHRPVLVLEQGALESRGSARSIEGFNIVEALGDCADLLTRYGGHTMAAGFTVPNANIGSLEARLAGRASQLSAATMTPSLALDARLAIESLGWSLLNELRPFAPYGMGNPGPTFLTTNLKVIQASAVGEGKHLRFSLSNNETGELLRAIGFNLWEKFKEMYTGWLDIAYTLEVNTWQGERKLQLRLKDIRPATTLVSSDPTYINTYT